MEKVELTRRELLQALAGLAAVSCTGRPAGRTIAGPAASRHSAASGGIRRHPAAFGGIRRYPAVSGGRGTSPSVISSYATRSTFSGCPLLLLEFHCLVLE
jgi:hypothetical protein